MPVPEALLITNTTLSITIKAFTACQKAYSLVKDIRDAPKYIQRLSTDVQGLYQVLGLLQTALTENGSRSAQLPWQMAQDLEVLLGTCSKLSIDVMTVVGPLIGADGAVKGGTWRSIKWELFKKNDVVNLQQTLATCKLTINMAISSLNFVTGNQTHTAVEQIQRDVAQLRWHAHLQEQQQEQQATSEKTQDLSSTRAVSRFSISSYNIPLRRFLDETESLIDSDSSSLGAPSLIYHRTRDSRTDNANLFEGSTTLPAAIEVQEVSVSSTSDVPAVDPTRSLNVVGCECAVCEESLEHIVRGERILQFSCGHASHGDCFYEYIREFPSPYCPICNTQLWLGPGLVKPESRNVNKPESPDLPSTGPELDHEDKGTKRRALVGAENRPYAPSHGPGPSQSRALPDPSSDFSWLNIGDSAAVIPTPSFDTQVPVVEVQRNLLATTVTSGTRPPKALRDRQILSVSPELQPPNSVLKGRENRTPSRASTEWQEALPSMIRYYKTGMSIAKMYVAIAKDHRTFILGFPNIIEFLQKLVSEGYPTDPFGREQRLREILKAERLRELSQEGWVNPPSSPLPEPLYKTSEHHSENNNNGEYELAAGDEDADSISDLDDILPWIPQARPDHKLFYYNTITGESSDHKPSKPKAKHDVGNHNTNTSKSTQNPFILRPFSIPQATPDGRLFYLNTETGESTMKLPEDDDVNDANSKDSRTEIDRSRPKRNVNFDTEADFDKVLDAAIEAAYEDG